MSNQEEEDHMLSFAGIALKPENTSLQGIKPLDSNHDPLQSNHHESLTQDQQTRIMSTQRKDGNEIPEKEETI